jgi:streptogrisin C
VAATLQESLKVLPGVELRLFLNKPVLAGALPSGPIKAGQRVAGRIPAPPATDVPAGSSVRITLPGREPLTIPVDAGGNWSFTAPAFATQFSAQAINGFSRSGISTFRTAAKPEQPAPVTPSDPSAAAGPGSGSKPSSPQPTPSRTAKPTVLTPAPEPSVVAVKPAGGASTGEGPAAAVALADTGAPGLLQAAGVAGAAVLLGGLLLVVVRRRGRR